MKGCKKVMRIGKILGIYSLLYFLAFLAKISHFTVLSSLIFLFLALFLYFAEKKEEETALPLSGIFALGLLGGEGIAVLQLSTLSNPWTKDTWLSFYLAYFFFYLLYHLTFRRPMLHEHKEQELQWEEDACFLKVCIIVLLAVSYLSFLVEAAVLDYVPLFTEHTPHAYSAFHLKGLHYFTTLFVLLPMLLVYLVKIEKKLSVFSFIAFFLALLLPILLVSRFQLIFSVVLFLFVLLLTGYRLHWKKLLLLFLFLLIAYLILTVERAHSVTYLLDIFSMKNKNIPIVFVQPYMYIANNYENFNLLTMKLEAHSCGFKMAYPFFTLTGLKFFVELPLAYPLYLTKEELSTLTILYDAYYDFGLLGVVLFSSFLGVGASFIKRNAKRANPFMMAILAQFAFYLLFSFFTTWFSNPSVLFYFGISLFFALLWQFRRKIRGKTREITSETTSETTKETTKETTESITGETRSIEEGK